MLHVQAAPGWCHQLLLHLLMTLCGGDACLLQTHRPQHPGQVHMPALVKSGQCSQAATALLACIAQGTGGMLGQRKCLTPNSLWGNCMRG